MMEMSVVIDDTTAMNPQATASLSRNEMIRKVIA